MSLIMKVPVGTALFTGMGVGFAANLAIAATDHDAHDGAGPVKISYLAAGPVLAGAGLLGAMSLATKAGPFVDRYAVDGAEQVARRSVSLTWASKSGRVGALASGLGLGIMSGMAGLVE
jgi:hypothetical protein